MKDDIELYSDPQKVLKKAIKLYGGEVDIDYSNKKNKKYMILNPITNKWVHFGQMGFSDYTKHNDKERRKAFLNRNHKWANQSEYTPGYMAYYLLW